jgi:hypothetical protein
MFARVRTMSLAGGGGLALAVTLAGVVAGATVLTAVVGPLTQPTSPVADTTAFVDLDANGVDDHCQTDVVAADPAVVAAAEAAVDLNGDGTISVSEAAQSGRTGGKNCNHGGYVSEVAHGQCAPDATDAATAAACTAETTDETTDATTPTVCQTTPTTDGTAPTGDVVPADLAPNAHGKAVALVAQSAAIGGKNCNHGGAVSLVAKKDHDAARAARDAAKLAREAARELRKAGKHHGKP